MNSTTILSDDDIEALRTIGVSTNQLERLIEAMPQCQRWLEWRDPPMSDVRDELKDFLAAMTEAQKAIERLVRAQRHSAAAIAVR